MFGIEMSLTLDTILILTMIVDMKFDQVRMLEELNMTSKSLIGQLLRVKP